MRFEFPYRRPARYVPLLLLAIAACGFPWLAAQTPAQSPADSNQIGVRVAPGVTYRHLIEISPTNEPWSLHILRINRGEKSIALRAVEGRDAQGRMQRERPTDLAARQGTDVVAVVDADFDLAAPYLGIPEGLSVAAGELWTTGKDDWPAMGQFRKGEPVIGRPAVDLRISVGKRDWIVASLNKPLGFASSDGPRLYTSAFGQVVKHDPPFHAIVIESISPTPPLHPAGTVRGRVSQTVGPVSEVAIPPGGMVLAFPAPKPATRKSALMGTPPRPEAKVTLRISVKIAGHDRVGDSSGGSHIIVRNGRKVLEGPHSDNLLQRHPRTAACYNNKEWIFAVVDGRQPQLSVGMTLDELSALMISLGCTEAINLDGGGSTLMAVRLPAPGGTSTVSAPLQIVNSPSDGAERGRGNAWLIIRKQR